MSDHPTDMEPVIICGGPMTEPEHDSFIVNFPAAVAARVVRIYQPQCGCGWVGQKTEHQEEAETEGKQHEES